MVAELLDADRRGVLHGRHVLRFDDGRVVSVADILRNRDQFQRATCADPLEPEYGGGSNKAVVFTDGQRARLFTHAHGGRLYDLAFDEIDIVDGVNAALGCGEKPEGLLKRHSSDIQFSAGGWPQVEAATGLKMAKALGFAIDDGEGQTTRPPDLIGQQGAPADSACSKETAVIQLDENEAVNLMMRDFNERFAVVAEGSSVGVARFAYNAEMERRSLQTMTLDGFKLLFGNRYVTRQKKTSDGEVVQERQSATTIWLRHPARRTCPDGYGLDPTGRLRPSCFNLWQGFGVEDKFGDWSKLRALIRDVLASGNATYDTYIMQWLAHLVQKPDENPGVALVFKGEEGVGKGTLGRALMRLLRPHAMQITHTKHLTGPFNAHMRTVLFLFADEAFFAGDKSNEGALKAGLSGSLCETIFGD